LLQPQAVRALMAEEPSRDNFAAGHRTNSQLGVETIRTLIFFSASFWQAALIRLTSDPVSIRMMSGLSLGASTKTHAPRRKPSAAAN
jgi:hypothetical protein